jgi:hypothetical protein
MPSTDSLLEPEQPRAADGTRYLLLTISALWCVYWFIHAWHYWEDDAYIHLEFARSVAVGQGFAFNGRIVAGDTAPLWVLLLAAMHSLIANWIVAGKVLTLLGAIFGFAGIYAFARRLATQLLPGGANFAAAAVLLIAVNPYTCYWIFSGMEAITAAGLACFAALAATRDRPAATSFLTACLLAGLAPLLRPEMIFLTALLAVPIFGQWRRLRAITSASQFGLLVAGLVLAAAPLALWSLYSFHAFGHVLPNTNAAKRAGPNQSVVTRLISIYSIGFPLIVGGVLAGIAAIVFRAARVRNSFRTALAEALHPTPPASAASPLSSLPLSGWIFICWFAIATVFYIVNHTYVQTRYILVPAPGLIIVILVQCFRFSKLGGRAVYGLALIGAIGVSGIVVHPLIRNKGLNCIASQDLALFIRNQIPPDAPVATYVIGQLAFVSQHAIVDTGGIVQPESIPYLRAHPGETAQWAASVGAQYYTDSRSPEPGATAVYTGSFPFIGWTFHPSLYSTSEHDSLWKLPVSPTVAQSSTKSPMAHP